MNQQTTVKTADRLVLACEYSPLVLAHARAVTEQIEVLHPKLAVEVLPLRKGGARRNRGRGPRDAFGAVGRGLADATVLPVDTMPVDLPPGLEVAAVMDRLVPFQALVSLPGTPLDELPGGVRVGVRDELSRFQLADHRADLVPVLLRAPLDRCLKWLQAEKIDALITPVAELEILGWQDAVSEVFDSSLFLPVPGRGAVALVSARGNSKCEKWLAPLDDVRTRAAVEVERSLVREMNAVHGLLCALAEVSGPTMVLEAALWSTDGKEVVRDSVTGTFGSSEDLAKVLAERLLEHGAEKLLRGPRRLARALRKVSKPVMGGS